MMYSGHIIVLITGVHSSKSKSNFVPTATHKGRHLGNIALAVKIVY